MGFLAVLLITGGALLAYCGQKGLSPAATTRAILRGEALPAPDPTLELPGPLTLGKKLHPDLSTGPGVVGPNGVTLDLAGGSSALGPQIVAAAERYIGVPYKFSGHTPAAFDCSGLVTWVLHHDLGINLPDNTQTVVSQFRGWSGAVDVDRSQIQPGDLVIYGVTHMGIVVNKTQFIEAPHTGDHVKIADIYYSPAPLFRRVKGA